MARTFSRILQLSLLSTITCGSLVATKRPIKLVLPEMSVSHQLMHTVTIDPSAMQIQDLRPTQQQYQLVKRTRTLLDQRAVVTRTRPTQLYNHIRATLSPRMKKQSLYNSIQTSSSQPSLTTFSSSGGPLSPVMPHKVTTHADRRDFIRAVSQNADLRRSLAQPDFRPDTFSDLVSGYLEDRKMNTSQKIRWLETVYYACHETQPFFPNMALEWYNDNQERIDQSCAAFFDLYDQIQLLQETVETPTCLGRCCRPSDLMATLRDHGLHLKSPEEYRTFWSDVTFLLGSKIPLSQFIPFVTVNIEAILPVYYQLHSVELTPENVLPCTLLSRLAEFGLTDKSSILKWLNMVHTFLGGFRPLYKNQVLLWAQNKLTQLNEFSDDIFALYDKILTLRWNVVASSQYALPPSSAAESKLLRLLGKHGINIQTPEDYAQFLTDLSFLLGDSLEAEAYLPFLLDDSTDLSNLEDVLTVYVALQALRGGQHLNNDDVDVDDK